MMSVSPVSSITPSCHVNARVSTTKKFKQSVIHLFPLAHWNLLRRDTHLCFRDRSQSHNRAEAQLRFRAWSANEEVGNYYNTQKYMQSLTLDKSWHRWWIRWISLQSNKSVALTIFQAGRWEQKARAGSATEVPGARGNLRGGGERARAEIRARNQSFILAARFRWRAEEGRRGKEVTWRAVPLNSRCATTVLGQLWGARVCVCVSGMKMERHQRAPVVLHTDGWVVNV